MTEIEALPEPEDKANAARWAESAKRANLLDGKWRGDAQEYFGSFYAAEVRMFLPPAQLGMNVFNGIMQQQSTSYDEDPAVTVEGAGLVDGYLDPVLTEECWPQMVDALPRIFGLHEVVCHVKYVEGRGIVYEMIDPQFIEGEPDPVSPDQFARLRRYSVRTRADGGGREWTRDVWDPTGLWGEGDGPVFRIEAQRKQGARNETGWVDVTEEYAPDAVDKYPVTNRAGAPLLPFVVFHSRVSNRLWSPFKGSELVDGTYTVSALNTFWLMNVRDNSSPVRGTFDADAEGVGQTDPQGGTATRYVTAHPGTILSYKSRGDRQGREFQWSPGANPMELRQAIAAYVQELAVNYGLSPSDMQITGGQSGYAIALGRDGQRKAQRRVEPALRRADRLRFALAAALVNAVEGTDLPEDPSAYRIEYRGNRKTADEVKAEQDEAVTLRENGVLSPVEHWQRVHPEDDDATALAGLVRAAQQERLLSTIKVPPALQMAPAPDDGEDAPDLDAEPDDETDADDLEPAAESA